MRESLGMNRTQIAVLGVAAVAFGGAYLAFNSLSVAPTAPQASAQAGPAVALERVLVASADIPMGNPLNATNTQWKDWPKASLSDQMIVQPKSGPMDDDTKGALARIAIMKDEPIRKDRIAKAGAGGLLSAILPAGHRAVNVQIDGNTGANNQPFVSAGDRVDVIKIARDEDQSRIKGVEVVVSQTIVENVNVLGVAGTMATLELDPDQAQIVILAQRQSNAGLRLALRSLLDSQGEARTVAKPQEAATGGVTIMRFGSGN
jgi:pilus assembly protein CpaB